VKNRLTAFLSILGAVCFAQAHKPYDHEYVQIERTNISQKRLRMEGTIAVGNHSSSEAIFACGVSDSTCLSPVLNTSYLPVDTAHYKCKNAYTLSPVDEENGNRIPVCLVRVE